MSKISLPKYRFHIPEIEYILIMFFSTRIILSLIGVLSRKLLELYTTNQFVYSSNIWLAIWGVWDTGWYLDISQNSYTPRSLDQLFLQQTNIVFFPLYPLFMRFLGSIIGNDYIAGVMISNFCLMVSCIYLCKLVSLDSDKAIAMKSVKYLLLFPVSFIFSGVFTESLYLALALMCFYYARTGKWQMAGITGFFLSLTRSVGVLIVLPLLYEGLMPLIKENKCLISFEDLKNSRDKMLPLFYIALIPLGTVSFMIFNYYLYGDFMAFAHAQVMWGRHPANPLEVLINGFNENIYTFFEAAFATTFIFILILFYRKIRFSYWLFSMYSIFIPLSTGVQSMPRYILVIFPIYILFADITNNRVSEDFVTVSFALLLGFLMVCWTNSFNLVV